MSKVYELPLAPSYVAHWGLKEAVRELLQNAIDSPAEFEYALHDDGLVLRSRGVTLDASTLVLGVTSKADDVKAIGSFGEGYKIALLVLTRLGLPTVVINGPVVWEPQLRQSRQFGTEVLHIVEREVITTADHKAPPNDLEFRVFGLTPEDIDAITEACLHMQPPVEGALTVAQGRILPSYPGKLFVGGLFVCDTELEFGYDLKPQFITLERDRQTVADWDLRRLACQMWMETEQHDRIAELISREVMDVKWVEYGGAPEQVKEACYRLFQQQHPGGIAAKSQKEMEELIERGLTKTVYVGGSYHSMVTGSGSYKEAEGKMVVVPSPQAVLQAFFDQYAKHMPRLPKVAMKKLIDRASDWRLK